MEQLRSQGLQVGGALTARSDTARGDSYDLVNQESGTRVLLAQRDTTPDICDLRFDESAFEHAERWCRAPGLNVVLIELGKIEASGRGLWPTFAHLMCGPPRLVLAVVRPEVLADIGLRLPEPVAWLDLTGERHGAGERSINLDVFVHRLSESARPAGVFGVRGHSDSGKTRLIEQLLPCLNARGLRVATVKHASHELALDVPGKDSRRHAEAGASRVLLIGPSSASLFVHRDSPAELQPWLPFLSADADLVLVEGYKKTPMPHVEIRATQGATWSLEQTMCQGQQSWVLNRPSGDGDLEYPEALLLELTQAIAERLVGNGSSDG